MVGMARAKTSRELEAAHQSAADTYPAQVVFAYRAFQLRSNSSADAERLLLLIPQSDEQLGMVISLGDSLCESESITDMEVLGAVSDGFARELANAVLVVPRLMDAYVAHSLDEVQNPHSDYAVRMRTVCRRQHRRFLAAVHELPKDKQRWFAEHVMEPQSCRVIALPEAEK